MMELTYIHRVIDDGQKCDIETDSQPCPAVQEPVVSNTLPAFLTETTSLGDQAKYPLLHTLFPDKQEAPTYEIQALFQEMLSLLMTDAGGRSVDFTHRNGRKVRVVLVPCVKDKSNTMNGCTNSSCNDF